MAETLEINVLRECMAQLEREVTNSKESINSAVNTMMAKVDEVLQKLHNCVAPFLNAADATCPTRPAQSSRELAARGDSDGISPMFGDESDSSNFNPRDENGDTALHIAAGEGHLEAVIVLLGKGAKINDLGHLLRTPLHCAAARGHLDVVQSLLESGAQEHAKDAQYKTPVALAADKEHTHIVDLLTQSMLRPSNPASPQDSLSSIDFVQYLKVNGLSLKPSDIKENALVEQTARAGRWDIVNFLLERGVSATDCTRASECALVLAAMADQVDAVRRLLRRGAASHAQQVHWGLLLAKSAAVVRVFGEEVPDAVRGRTGQFAMIEAAREGRLELLAALLDLGVDINCKYIRLALTALMRASSRGHVACVEELLRRGADVGIQDKNGYTALHFAGNNYREDCVRALLEAGASRTVKNKYGKTPLEVTNSEVIRRLFNTVA